jgi:hypothetical protein
MTSALPQSRAASLLKGGFDRETAVWAGRVTGFVAVLAVASSSLLYFHNLHGPLGDHPSVGTLVGLACGGVAGAGLSGVTSLVARHSRVLLVLLVGLLLTAGWVLLPRQIDVSESFLPHPNPRWSCTGWSFRHYPPGVYDGDATTYCVGLEKRIADG